LLRPPFCAFVRSSSTVRSATAERSGAGWMRRRSGAPPGVRRSPVRYVEHHDFSPTRAGRLRPRPRQQRRRTGRQRRTPPGWRRCWAAGTSGRASGIAPRRGWPWRLRVVT